MQNVKGYILAVALFLVCCWVNPNDAIPYRTRPRVKEQVDYRPGNRAEASALEFAHRAIGQPDFGADKKPALSGGGKKWRTLQPPRSHRGRMKDEDENVNVNINVNTNEVGRIKRPIGRLPKIGPVPGRFTKIGQSDSRLSKIGQSNDRFSKIGKSKNRLEIRDDAEMTQDSHNVSKTKIEMLNTEEINCSQPHNEDDRYSSSFNVNSSLIALNVSDDFQVTGEEGPKQSSSVHVGEDITLCWIETTTIKEDHSVHPVQRLVIREYTISFENSATIPNRYLECIQIEGEVDGKNSTVPTSALFEVIDENTHHSRVVNFTTVSHSDTLTVWQHKRVRCGVGPVVTKTVIEWPDDKLTRKDANPKKRVEIKVSPKIHKLTAHPTDTEPCTTDNIDSELNYTTPVSLSPPVDCGPGITCDSDCVNGDCKQPTVTNAGSESSVFYDEITPSYITTTDADEEIDRITDTTDDYESTEPLSTPATEGLPSVTDEMIDSSEEIMTPDFSTTMQTKEDDAFYTERPVEDTTIIDSENWTTMYGFETSSSMAPSTVLSVTLTNEPVTSIETGNQEVEVPDSSEESSSGTSEIEESCESGESCTDYSSESSTTSSEEFSTSEVENIDTTTTTRDGETADVGEFSTTPTTDASAVQTSESTTQDDSDYSSVEEWDTATPTTQSQSNITVTEMIESRDTISDVTDSSFTTTELQSDESTETSMNANQTDSTDRIFGTTTTSTTMTTSIRNIITTLNSITNVDVPKDETTTGFDLTIFSTTEVSATGDGDNDEDITNETLLTDSTSEASITEETTTEKSSSGSCENSDSCDSSSENENNNIVVPGESSLEECDNENGTVTCGPSSVKPENTTEISDTNTTDVTEMTMTMTTETGFPTSDGPSTASHNESTVKETTIDVSGSGDGATTQAIERDSETTTEETTTEERSSTTCENSESCDSSSENDNVNIIVPGDSTTEECDSENGTATCLPTSVRPGDTTEIIDMNTMDTTQIIMTMTTETDLPTSYGLSTTPEGDTVVKETTVDVSSSYEEPTTPTIKVDGESTTEEVTTEKRSSTTCENSESCDSSSENENVNIIVPGDSSTEECDSENGTMTCMPTTATPKDTTEIAEMNRTHVTEMTMPMTTETDLPTSYGLATTPRGVTIVQETTVDVSSSYEEVTTPTIKVDGETTTEETTTEERSSTTCENSESCDFSSENENVNIVPGDSSTEDCDNENGTVTCMPASAKPGDTTEISDTNTTDVTEITMTMTTETDLSTNDGPSTASHSESTVKETTTDVSGSSDGATSPAIDRDSETTTEEITTEERSSTTCENSDGCDSSSENENVNIIVPGDSTEECDSENGTVTCMPTSAKPGGTTEIVDMTTTEPYLSTSSNETIGESTTSHGEMTTGETTTDLSGFQNETATEETISEISYATTEETTWSNTTESDNTTEESTTGVSDATTEVMLMLTTSGDETTEVSAINIDSTTEITTSTTVLDGERTTEAIITHSSDAVIDITSSSTTEYDHSEFIDSSTEGSPQTSTELRPEGSTIEIGDSTTETTTNTTDNDIEGSTGTVLYILKSTTDGVTETVFTTTDANAEMYTPTVGNYSMQTTIGTVTSAGSEGTTSDYSTLPSTQAGATTEEPMNTTSSCDTDTGECDMTETVELIPTTPILCDPESGSCDTEDGNGTTVASCDEESDDCSTDSSSSSEIPCDAELGDCSSDSSSSPTVTCDRESGDCSSDSSSSPTVTCDRESGDCSSDSSSSPTVTCDRESGDCSSDSSSSPTVTCDRESGDCSVGSSTIPTTECDEGSSSSCKVTSESPQYSTTIDISETCDDRPTGNCTIPTREEDITDLPATTSSTPVEVENISTTVSDVPTTVDNRRTTTVTATSKDPNANHKLALTIKILLEHIDGNQKKQKLYEIEKHLLFDEHPEDLGNLSLMKKVKSLNNTVSMQTVEALFNCSSVEKLTGDVGDFAAKYVEMQNKIRRIHGSNSNSSNFGGLHKSWNSNHSAKPKVDPNLEMSLPGIHADIHSGLSHVMSRVSSENEAKRQALGLSEDDNPPSRILKVVADPRDKRVHRRRKRQTLEGLTIAEQDLPKDVEEVGHWSNERVRRAINGGHVRSLTEFTIYKGP